VARFGLFEAETATEVAISFSRLEAFSDEAAVLADDDGLGLHLALIQRQGSYGLLEYCR
jgi:hypothetical protein